MQLRELDPIVKEIHGYSFGKPLRVDEKSLSVVLPIIREVAIIGRAPYSRNYITYPEANGKVTVKDTGSIGSMEAVNTSKENIFMRSGTIFTGSTQTRALHRSAVLLPGKTHRLNVHCIFQSKPISGGAQVKYGGLTSHDFDTHVYGDNFSPKSQSEYWSAAHATSAKYSSMAGGPGPMRRRMSSMVRSRIGLEGIIGSDHVDMASLTPPPSEEAFDDLAGSIDSFAQTFDSVLSKVKCLENQAGLALLNQAGVETIELFDHPQSWKALHEAAVKRIGSNIVQKDDENVFEYKPEIAKKRVVSVLALDWEKTKIFEHDSRGHGQSVRIYGITSDKYVGEIVEVDSSMIHLVILKKAA